MKPDTDVRRALLRRIEIKANGPAAVKRRGRLLAAARCAGPEGVYLRGVAACDAGAKLAYAGLGKVVRRDREEASRFVAEENDKVAGTVA